MSIATRKGDDGSTSLLFGRRVPKNHPRVVAYGTVDELGALLGVARAQLAAGGGVEDAEGDLSPGLLRIQHDLLALGGELAVDPQDFSRFQEKSQHQLSEADLTFLDNLVVRLERLQPPFRGFVLPGSDVPSAQLHLARTVCRRAERAVLDVGDVQPLLLRYLNRLSDVLWLLAEVVSPGTLASEVEKD